MRNKITSEEITREYLDSLLIEMRCLDAVMPNTEMELFGKTFDTPIAPSALSHLPDMAEWAEAGRQANAVVFAGICDEATVEAMTRTGAQVIKIIKPLKENSDVICRIEHAAGAGVLAVGMDIDHGFNRAGGYDVVEGLEMRPKTTKEIAEFVKAAEAVGKPFVAKGVLSVMDAVKCRDAGVAGIMVSHHNGRQDYAVPPLMLLPEIRAAVGNEMKIFVDCALISGADAFKALALGANGCAYGRSLMHKLKEGGVSAMAEEIRNLTTELAYTMGMTASPDIRHIDPSVIRKR